MRLYECCKLTRVCVCSHCHRRADMISKGSLNMQRYSVASKIAGTLGQGRRVGVIKSFQTTHTTPAIKSQ